jgi:hypothetical protein
MTKRRGRIVAVALLACAYAAPGARAQEEQRPSAGFRVYVIDRAAPGRSLEDVAVSLTVRYRTGRGETLLLSRVTEDPGARGAGDAPAAGAIRGLVGSAEYVELYWTGRTGGEPRPKSEAPRGERPSGRALPPARDVLAKAHRGAFFTADFPGSRVIEAAAAWVTVRRGSESWTSEEFQGPSAPAEPEGATLAAVDRTLRTIEERSGVGATFMMLRPQVVLLIAELAKLAPAEFMDDSGAFGEERRRCLAYARAIENSCAYGDWGQVATLSLQCEPRVRAMESLRNEPARPEVPTLDHQP